jgi:hypothetical protein
MLPERFSLLDADVVRHGRVMRIGITVLVLSGAASAFASSASPNDAAKNGSRITVITEQLVGADGSATTPTERFRDEKLKVDCTFRVATDGALRCLPTAGLDNNINTFSDASCTAPLARHETKCAGPSYVSASKTATDASGKTTDVGVRIFPIIGEYPRSGSYFTLFRVYSPPKCVEAVRLPMYTYHTLGAEMAPTEFVASTERPTSAVHQVPLSGSRITVGPPVAGPGGATTTLPDRFRDEKLDVYCSIARASDGVLRCLPNVWSADITGAFADASCTTRVAILYLPKEVANPSYAVRSTYTNEGCGQPDVTHSVFAVLGEYSRTGPLFVTDSSGKCVEAKAKTRDWLPPNMSFTVGAEMAPTKFVAFEKRTF